MSLTGTTLNPADVASGAGTDVPNLSNGNLTLSGNAGSSNYMAVRSIGEIAAGVAYFEVTINAQGGNGFAPGVGLAEAGASLAGFTYTGIAGTDWPGGFIWLPSGALYVDGTLSGSTWSTYTTGAVLGFAYNASSGMIWGRAGQYGLWNGSLFANPNTNQGGLDISALAGNVKAVGWLNEFSDAAVTQITFNFNFTAFPPTNKKNCLVWARAIHIPVSGPVLPGPFTSTGPFGTYGTPDIPNQKNGYPFAGPALPGDKVYLTAFGTGDGSVALNLQPPFFAPPPRGYYPGWPGEGLDPTLSQGSAIGNTGYLVASFPTTPGMAQSQTGVTFGAYYFEYVINATDSFTENMGVGVGRLQPDLSAWSDGGGFSVTDSNGGAQLNGGSIVNGFQAALAANEGPLLQLPSYKSPAGQVIGVAVLVTDSFGQAIYNAQQLQPVSLVCVPCAPLLIGPNGFGGFGR